MCGISGLLRHGVPPTKLLPDERQRHRGPDDEGFFVDPACRAQLAFRRLSIIDLSSAGHQPMANEDDTVWLIFNGEIYNHRELRADLERRGHRFRSRTDSEVLVHLWEDEGRNMVRRLNGMFAFCIWDERTGEAFLARDHAGIKPLYLANSAEGLAFASEAKVLLSLRGVDRSIDPVSLQHFLTFLWVPGERTMWRGVRRLRAGGWLSWRDGRIDEGTWWDWDQSTKEKRGDAEWIASTRTTLVETVERQLMSDVPLGALLSGGLDSSAIVGAMHVARPHERITAYTANSPGSTGDGFASDLPYAREMAAFVGARLVEEELSPTITELLPRLVWHSDEPLADPAIVASYLLCRRARQDGTIVLLSGQGADELYHGYRSHRAVEMAGRLSGIPSPLVRAATAIVSALAERSGVSAEATPRRALKMLRFIGADGTNRILQLADWGSPAMRREILSDAVRRDTPSDIYADYLALFEQSRAPTDEERWTYVLFKTFMPSLNLTYGDRTSMATSVELRVPYLDRALIEQAGRMPLDVKQRGRSQKWILQEAARPWLPPSILSRSKTGFGAPIREWLSGQLMREMRSALEGDQFLDRGLFDAAGIRGLLRDLETGRRDVAYIVWALFTFEIWARTFVDADGAAPISAAA
ncbi:MAG TPA: asparagine synthase (glutamine-hydrolyzing) [Gemmatimonadaceae bacterium]|nr:asparagine synthase (glutamine-hydrolyzing) [Gemmatimonadaceae bacterium]